MEQELYNGKMEIYRMENGWMNKILEEEYTNMFLRLDTMEHGNMANFMEKEL